MALNHFALVSVPDRLLVAADWNSSHKPHLDFIIVVAYTPAAVDEWALSSLILYYMEIFFFCLQISSDCFCWDTP